MERHLDQSPSNRQEEMKMIKRIGCFVIITVMLSAFSFGISHDSEDPKTRILEASNAMFGTSATKGTLVNSLVQLLDVVITLTSTSQYKDEIAHHVEVAKDLIKNQSLFNDKSRQYLSFAYRMVTNGKKYEKPKELEPTQRLTAEEKQLEGNVRKLLSLIESRFESKDLFDNIRLEFMFNDKFEKEELMKFFKKLPDADKILATIRVWKNDPK